MDLAQIIMYVLAAIGALLTILIAYGAVVKKRDLILTGLFYYSFLPIIGETMMYLATQGTYHILFIALFLIQMVIASVKSVPFDPTDKTLMEYAKRMGGTLLIINITSAVFVLVIATGYPVYLGVFHTVISISLAYGIIQRLKGKLNH